MLIHDVNGRRDEQAFRFWYILLVYFFLSLANSIIKGSHRNRDTHGLLAFPCIGCRFEIPQQIINMMPIGESDKNSERKEQKEENERFYAPEAKVLVVDDNKMNLKVMQALMKRTGIVPDIADGGNACLQMTRSKKYDLILMDHMMPEPDGIQTLHMLRDDKDNVNAKTEVIVLTANAIEGMREKYLAEGFTDYLSKPVEAVRLENMLAKYLKEKAPSSSD